MSKDDLKKTVRDTRRDLNFEGLNEADASDNPLEQFQMWMKDAVDHETLEPNAMTLATASSDAQPSARTVLLKDYSEDGFTFFTDYSSRKGQNLAQNAKASLVLYWKSLSRQVLIDGSVKKVDRATSEEYFHSRPRGSQIAAYTSDQSQPIAGRLELEEQIKQTQEKFKDQEIPCPEDWGGYCLIPERIEFWQGRRDRTHDRLCYTKKDGAWHRERLYP